AGRRCADQGEQGIRHAADPEFRSRLRAGELRDGAALELLRSASGGRRAAAKLRDSSRAGRRQGRTRRGILIRKTLLVGLVVVLTLPLIRFAMDEFAPDRVVDTNSPAWKAREALIARAGVFVSGPRIDPHPLDPAITPE